MIERGAIKVRPVDLEPDTWTGVRVDIGEGSNFHRQFDIMASPKGAKFEIVPLTETWRAIVIRMPDGSDVQVVFYGGHWHVNAYDPSGHYMGSIDQKQEVTER